MANPERLLNLAPRECPALIFTELDRCPLFTRKRTSAERIEMSVMGHFRTHAVQQATYSITSSARPSNARGTARRVKYIWRSLKTSNEAMAIQLGRRLLFQLEQRTEQGLPPKSKRFSNVIDDYIRYNLSWNAEADCSRFEVLAGICR